MDEQEFERDEQLLEARRLKRLEDRRRRKMQQRIVLGLLLVILILSVVLIVRGMQCPQKNGADAANIAGYGADGCIAGGRSNRAGYDRDDCGCRRYHDVRRTAGGRAAK